MPDITNALHYQSSGGYLLSTNFTHILVYRAESRRLYVYTAALLVTQLLGRQSVSLLLFSWHKQIKFDSSGL
jgi:hypothetical protein